MEWIRVEFPWCDGMSEASLIAFGYLYVGDGARDNSHFDRIVGFYTKFGHLPSIQQMSAFLKAERRPVAETQTESVLTTSVASGADSMDYDKSDDPTDYDKSPTTLPASTQTDVEEETTQHQDEVSNLQQNNSATSGEENGLEGNELEKDGLDDDKDIAELNQLVRKRSQSELNPELNPSKIDPSNFTTLKNYRCDGCPRNTDWSRFSNLKGGFLLIFKYIINLFYRSF